MKQYEDYDEVAQVGDTIKIDYKIGRPFDYCKTGIVESVSDWYGHRCIHGTWGNLGLIESIDYYTIIKKKNKK